MSLIHKALRKAENPSVSDIGDLVTPEERLVSEQRSRFFSANFTPRTLGLVALTALAAIFAVYMNFCAEKGVKKAAVPAPPKVPEAAVVAALQKPEVQEEVAAEAPVVGVSRGTGGMEKKMVLPSPAELLVNQGEEYFLSGDLNKALAKFTEALTIVPDSPKILNSMGLVFKKKGSPVEAERYYNEAIKNGPECAECLNNFAVLKADGGDNVSAVLYLKKAIAISETYADSYFNLAVIMEKEGNYKSAVEYYKNFLTYTSSDSAELKNKVKMRIEDLALNWEE